MNHHFAAEIILTRPATAREIQRACRVVPLATNADRTRLMTVYQGKTPGRALRSIRRRLHGLLPIDVLTTHYPDQRGQVLLNISLSRAVRAEINQAAAAHSERPEQFLSRSMTESLARQERDHTRRLTEQLEALLAQHSSEDVLVCTARALLHRRLVAPRP
ncbi:hypothetical protein [Streptomyces albicerus]|uniref:hypothetical protein n=1 Tax=Streptomyces albicerus TaxID=2569859 RepID=UPI00124B1093|nr:hypothetical protein [Streptomyces albicerus]